jgi:hypothetical protein
MGVSFRQTKEKKSRSCQNGGLIPTGEGEKAGSCQNRGLIPTGEGVKKQGAVRKPVSFGQAKVKKLGSCQNGGLIPTGEGEQAGSC